MGRGGQRSPILRKTPKRGATAASRSGAVLRRSSLGLPEREQPDHASASVAEHAHASEQLFQLVVKQQFIIVPEQLQQLFVEQLEFLVEQFQFQQFQFEQQLESVVEFFAACRRFITEPVLSQQRRAIDAGLPQQPAERKSEQPGRTAQFQPERSHRLVRRLRR
ncbi:MAG: hypothetical protein AAGI72_10075 [Pseudomonadota bacterium]